MENAKSYTLEMVLAILLTIATIITSLCVLNGCTLSFQNVMTSGEASDVVDSDPSTDAKVDATLDIPALPL